MHQIFRRDEGTLFHSLFSCEKRRFLAVFNDDDWAIKGYNKRSINNVEIDSLVRWDILIENVLNNREKDDRSTFIACKLSVVKFSLLL